MEDKTQLPDVIPTPQAAAVPARRQPRAVIPTTPAEMLGLAVQQGASVEQMDKLITLMERTQAIEARQQFVHAMTVFKQNPPRIEKTRTASVTSSREGARSYTYKFANLADVCEQVVEALAKVGISHDWSTKQDGAFIAVTCTLTHAGGHHKSTMLSSGIDESGGKNRLQALGSAVSYLERYTLLAACGLAVDDEQDDDGNGGLTEAERGAVGDAVKASRSRNQKPADVAAGKRANGKHAEPDADLLKRANEAADAGHATFGPFWRGLSEGQRQELAGELAQLQQRAGSAR